MAALGTDTEREQWARVQRIEGALAGAPDTPDNADLRARLALVKGVLLYRLNDAYGARLWQEHRGLKDLDLALHEAQSRWIRVERARKNVPTNTGEFAARVAALKVRIDALQTRLADAETAPERLPGRRSPCRSCSSRRSGSAPIRCRHALRWRPCTTGPPTPKARRRRRTRRYRRAQTPGSPRPQPAAPPPPAPQARPETPQ